MVVNGVKWVIVGVRFVRNVPFSPFIICKNMAKSQENGYKMNYFSKKSIGPLHVGEYLIAASIASLILIWGA